MAYGGLFILKKCSRAKLFLFAVAGIQQASFLNFKVSLYVY